MNRMDDGITVKEFKYIPGVNDAKYIKKLEKLHENDRRIISTAVAKIKKLSAQMKEQPKRGKWILNRSGAYCCSECMEPCATYVMMRPRDRFCKMCGADMRGGEVEWIKN